MSILSYIMARTSYIQWNDDDVHFILDQHVELDFYFASSVNNSLCVYMSHHSDTLTWFRAN
jgi:hypothetical protein